MLGVAVGISVVGSVALQLYGIPIRYKAVGVCSVGIAFCRTVHLSLSIAMKCEESIP